MTDEPALNTSQLSAREQAEAPKRSLVRKLCEIMEAVGYVQKTGINRFHGYKYATEADLVEMIRGEFAKRQVFVFPDVIDYTRVPLEVETAKGIRKTQISEVKIAWTFVDGESGEERTVHVHGVGEDNVDKGFYKAFTGSEKYLLMKSFLIPTGDDPEHDEANEVRQGKEAASAVASEKLRKAAEKKSDTAVALTEWKEGLVAVSGGGLAILKAEIEPEALKDLGFKLDGNVVTIPASKAFAFEDLCKRAKVDIHWAESAKKATGG